MAMKLLKAREFPTRRIFRVLLDESKVDAQGKPDPLYVREWEWPIGLPIAKAKQETKRLAQLELDRINDAGDEAGTVLAGEGETL